MSSWLRGICQLLKRLGEVPHISCVLFTSREKPREIVPLEGDKTEVRSLPLKGLNSTEGQQLFQQKGQFTGTEREWQELIEHYAGNPLALKMVAAGTQELFNDNIAPVLQYVEQGILIFDDIRDLLERQFQRLSAVEEEVMYWLAINREPVSFTFHGHKDWVWSVSFSPDGNTLATGSGDCSVKLWDVREGKSIKTLEGHTDGVWSVSFSLDGKMLASASLDGSIRLWDSNNFTCIKVLQGHTAGVWSASFSPDGCTLASASSDQTIRL
jgi:hypothetical protein